MIGAAPRTGRRPGPLTAAAAALAALIFLLHAPVFTRQALISPAGMHYAQWPWKAHAPAALQRGALLEENHTLSDLLFQVDPWQRFIVESARQGRLPLWNPRSYCGVPFVANAQSAVFYPLHWPVWIAPSLRVFTAALLAKILLSGLFMALFLRGLGCGRAACVLGACSFALCGFMTCWLGYAHTNVAIFLPLLMHAARRLALSPGPAPFLVLTAAGAAQYLGGHPETSLHVMGVVLAWFLAHLREAPSPRRSAGLFAGSGLLGFGIAAVQMIPFLEYLMASAALRQRQELATVDWALPSDAVTMLLLPNRYGRPWDFSFHATTPYQTLAGYAGAGALLLAVASPGWLAGRPARFMQALAAVCALVVYGPAFVREALGYVPVLGIASNNRLLLMISFAVATLAALVVQRAADQAPSPDPASPRARRLAWLAGAGALLAVTLAFQWSADPGGARLSGALAGATLLMTVLAAIRPSRGATYAAGLAVLACLDMFLFAWRFNPHADPSALFPRTGLTDFLKADSQADPARGGRMMTIGWTMRPETQMAYGLSSIEGYDAMEIDAYRRLLDQADVAGIHLSGDVPAASRRLLDDAALRYLVTPPGGVVSGEAMKLAFDGPEGRVFVNEAAAPRFEVRPAAPLRVERDEPGEMRLSISGLPAAGRLTVRETRFAGWKGRVNGAPADIAADHPPFMSLRLPPGDSVVELTYAPASFTLGAALTLVCLAGAAAASWRISRGLRTAGGV